LGPSTIRVQHRLTYDQVSSLWHAEASRTASITRFEHALCAGEAACARALLVLRNLLQHAPQQTAKLKLIRKGFMLRGLALTASRILLLTPPPLRQCRRWTLTWA
jgi:hypothetical protein